MSRISLRRRRIGRMGISIEGFLEVSREGVWSFAEQMVPNPDQAYDPDEPALMPKPLFESGHWELAAILAGVGNPVRSKDRPMRFAWCYPSAGSAEQGRNRRRGLF